jgi:raffinose/stachyose/melibiose transport system substrate-binding protein
MQPTREVLGLRLKTWCWLAGFLAALASSGHRLALSESSPNRLKFAHTYTTESERAILDDAIAEFEAGHPGVRIDQIVSNSEVYNTVGWRLQFQGRNQPDIYFHWQGFKVEYCIASGWAMNLEPHLSSGFLDQFTPSAIQRQNGGIYFLPQSADISNLVWYNRELFDRLGLGEPGSLEQWIGLCATLRRQGILPLAQGNRDLWPMGNFSAELLGQALGAGASARLFQPGVRVQTSQAGGLRTLVGMRDAGCFDLPGALEKGAIGSLGDIDAKVFFLSGKSAQHILGSWFLADIQDAKNKGELKFSVGVFPVPAAAGEVDAMTAVSTGFLVNPSTRNPGAAVAFLELLLSRKYQGRFAKLGNLSLRRDAAGFMEDPLGRRMLEILAAAPVIVPPPDTGYRPEQAAAFYETCGKMLAGKLDLDQAVAFWSGEKESLARKGL